LHCPSRVWKTHNLTHYLFRGYPFELPLTLSS